MLDGPARIIASNHSAEPSGDIHVFEEEKDMHARLYRLLEKHQRIDEPLRLAHRRRRAARIEIVRLRIQKLRAKNLLLRFARTPEPA